MRCDMSEKNNEHRRKRDEFDIKNKDLWLKAHTVTKQDKSSRKSIDNKEENIDKLIDEQLKGALDWAKKILSDE